MYGFNGYFSANKRILIVDKHDNVDIISNEARFDCFSIKQMTLNKFINDKVFYNDDDLLITLEGVVYNFKTLEKDFPSTSRGGVLKKAFVELGITRFANSLEGIFDICLFDKSNKQIYLFSDFSSHRPIWYIKKENELFFSTDIDWLYRTLKTNNINLSLDFDGAISLLNYGFMIGNKTVVSNVHKVLPGEIIQFNVETAELGSCYYFHPTYYINKRDISSKESLNLLYSKVNELFEKSIISMAEKNKEYGYKNVVTLSAGLDSRLIFLTLKKLGYEAVCVSMGNHGCDDLTVSSKICNDNLTEHIIFELDNGLFLNNVDSAVVANGGNIQWPGYAGCQFMNEYVNYNHSNLGLIFCGDGGDYLFRAPFDNFDEQTKSSFDIEKYGSPFFDCFSKAYKETEIKRYPLLVDFLYYNRCLNANGNGGLSNERYTETALPFLDKKLVETMMNVPANLINDNKFYNEYFKRFCPQALNYIWDHTGCTPNASKLKKEIVFFRRRIQHKLFGKGFMYTNLQVLLKNKNLVEYLDNIYASSIDLVPTSELKENIKLRYSSNKFINKTLAIILLRTIQYYEIEV